MSTLAAIALVTEQPNMDVMLRKPDGRWKALISRTMMKNILGQALFMISVLLILLFYGDGIFCMDTCADPDDINASRVHFTAIFNTFVLMNLFNELNARMTNGLRNMFSCILPQLIFPFIWICTLTIQILILQFGGSVFSTTPLSAKLWFYCILLGAAAYIWGQLISFISMPKNICKFGRRDRAAADLCDNEKVNFEEMENESEGKTLRLL
ncbi:plasma membrane calcium-transporting ATPase 2-like [Hyalella azteca]|uniref:Plasma membrane calcium-transporting ATPase 2-like n=1 Tax=Hyalella azteca TaxID=294128 RepID=A0A979FMA8_HYAAZ|nr:plasma membrane calcium-transporting ATPase 2-like [Hyalella azteca]